MAKEKPEETESGQSARADEMEAGASEALQAMIKNGLLRPEELVADLRDTMLELFRHRPALWESMQEAEQRDVARIIHNCCVGAISEACAIIASEGRPSISAKLEKCAFKGGTFAIALKAMGGPELAAEIAELDGHEVLIISADAAPFSSPRQPATMADQAPLEFDEAEPDLPAHEEETGELMDEALEEEKA